MRSAATSELATPEVESPPVKKTRLCRACGRYFDGQTCTACEFVRFMKDEPKVSDSGWPCAICGTTEASTWYQKEVDNFKVRLQMVTRPQCSACYTMRQQNKAPARDTEEMWLDLRIAEELGLSTGWSERGGEPWVTKAHGLSRLFLKVDDDHRPMIACEHPKYVQGGPSRRPLWWIKNLNKTMAEAYFAEYGQLKIHEFGSGPEPTYIYGHGFVGGEPYFFTGHKPGVTTELGW
jgi:hypothetical protein